MQSGSFSKGDTPLSASVTVNDRKDLRLTALPKVVCVVLNWNGWMDTIECLESLLRSTYACTQIVVCDNGSQDHSMERLREWADGLLEFKLPSTASNAWQYRPARKPIPYVRYESPQHALAVSTFPDVPIVFIQNGSNLGYAGGNNVGIRFAMEVLQAQYVWVLNNDTVVDRDAITHFSQAFELNPKAGVLGARLMAYKQGDMIQALGGGQLFPRSALDTQVGRGRRTHADLTRAFELDHVVGASMFVRASAIQEAGLLDESYFLYREETDWCLEVRKRGWQLMYCPQGVVWHKEGHSMGFKSVLHDYYAVRNMLYLIEKHFPQHLRSAFAISLLRASLPKLLRLQFRRLRFVIRAYSDYLRGVRGRTDVNPDLYFLLENREQD